MRLRSQRFRTRSLGIYLKPNLFSFYYDITHPGRKGSVISRTSIIHPTPSGYLQHDSKTTIYIIVYRLFFQGYHSHRNTFRFLRIQRVVTWGNTLLSVHFYFPLPTQVRDRKHLWPLFILHLVSRIPPSLKAQWKSYFLYMNLLLSSRSLFIWTTSYF